MTRCGMSRDRLTWVFYENTGTVHLNPYGEISITNMFGEEVDLLSWNLGLYCQNRYVCVKLSGIESFYSDVIRLLLRVNRGYNDIVDEVAVSFWVLPWKIVGGVFLTLFIIIFSVRAFFRTFEFKRKDACKHEKTVLCVAYLKRGQQQ